MNCSKANETLRYINTSVTNIESDVNDLNKNKIYFNALMSDGTQDALERLDYTSSPIIFEWQNDKDVPVYIIRYIFQYDESNEPQTTDMYHSSSFTNKLGVVNSEGADIEEPYMLMESNRQYLNNTNPKRTWFGNVGWFWRYDFIETPIEIGVSGKFGHYISGDFTGAVYDNDPIGHLEGYYYNS